MTSTRTRLLVLGIIVVGLGLITWATRTAAQTDKGAGDEPPIRVKNGSIDLELVSTKSKKHEWETPTQGKWHIKNEPTRLRNTYLVLVAPTIVTPKSPCNKLSVVADSATIEFTDGTKSYDLTFTAHDGTKLTSTLDSKLTLTPDSSDASVLKGGDKNGFISSIMAKDLTCTFTAKDDALQVVLLDLLP